MADEEAKLAAEIARLEHELLKAKHVSNLKQELSAVKNVLDEDEFMIIQDLIDDTGEEEYEEVTEQSYDEGSYEEVEEYTDDEYSEYEEVTDYEDDCEDDDDVGTVDDTPPVQQPAAQPRASTQAVPNATTPEAAVQPKQQKQRRFPWARRKQEDSTAKKAQNTPPPAKPVTQTTKPPPAQPVTQISKSPQPAKPVTKKTTCSVPPAKAPTPKKDEDSSRAKKKVRPPPSKGGKPIARVDPKEPPKSTQKNPLSRLIKRNTEEQEKRASGDTPKPESAPEESKEESAAERKKKIIRRLVKKNTAGKPAETKKTQAPSNAPFKRRPIPNLQPSPTGEETIFEQLLGQKLITSPKLHKSSTKGCMKDQELICFYFGAVWKSDCKRFNTLLKDFYYSVAQQTHLEVVYISADRSLIEFKDCFTTMPFLAMPAGTTSLKNELTKALKIIEMPALVVLDDEGSVVTVEGVQKIQELERGNAKQALQLVDRWKKTRPIPIGDVQLDKTLLHGNMERGTIYWQG